ncbi:MAG: tellurium resistance protein TerC [Caulobacteraceae bacterium]|nr:tellurium resistance protein TerC [Caulobacteraceae bacterium]
MISLLAAPALAGPLIAFAQVVMIDIALAGDNAVAVGMAAAGLPAKDRRRAIVLGLMLAVVLLIGFALVAVQLLNVVGLLLAGGILLLWVCWKMWRDLHHADHGGEEALDGHGKVKRGKTLAGAMLQIVLADLSMSLDNVLAVAGAARDHPQVLIFGLALSVTLMGVAAHFIAGLLSRHRWIGYIGLTIVLYVALHMIWEGHRDVAVKVGQRDAYNAVMPKWLAIPAR